MLFTFGECSIDCDRRELSRGTELVAVEPQVFDVLVYLIRHRDRVVSRDDLLAGVAVASFLSRLWPAALTRPA
jgi:DNA-binding winged helix-turn-helix (wHTH) protein